MSVENFENIALLKQKKVEISAQIKILEETPDAKNKAIWFILIRILAIAMGGFFIMNYKVGLAILGGFIIVLIIGILDRIIAQNKNKKRNQEIIVLKAEEARIVSALNTVNNQ